MSEQNPDNRESSATPANSLVPLEAPSKRSAPLRPPRCIHCSRMRLLHGANGLCPGTQGTSFATMQLPEGRNCSDCQNFKRFCKDFLGYKGTETNCDWWPIRFVPLKPIDLDREENTLP